VIPGYVLQVLQTNGAGTLDLNTVLSSGPASRATDVERTHRQLGTRLTDGLGRDNTYRFADIDLVTTRQVTTVTGGAHAVAGFTGNRRTHDHFVDTVGLEEFDPLLVDQGATGDNDLFGARLEHITGNDSA